jgi:tRNA_anti-like
MSRPTAFPLLKTLGLMAMILGGALYGGHMWLNRGPEVAAPEPTPAPKDESGEGLAASRPANVSMPRQQNAKDLAQAYANDSHTANARFKGQRMQIQGIVADIEPGQGQVLLINFAADDGLAGLRAVVDGATNPLVEQAMVGQPLALDCLNQGLLMAEPVLSDCRVLP